ncbi:MAG: hypothetical protein HZA84_08830 [Thaumarchaeota archaeon]|nr:hypothetical protein [Nitrososphaerota archaeon]
MKIIAISALVLSVLLFAAPHSHAFAEVKGAAKFDVKSIMTTYKIAVEKARADFKAAVEKSQADARNAISKGIPTDKINADSKAAIDKARLDYSAAMKKAQAESKASLNQIKAGIGKKLSK